MDVWHYSSFWIRIQLMKTPFFSIIIPALNEEKYIANLLNDLANQTFKDFEVIIVDGKSDDKTIKIANSFQDKLPSIRIITSPRRHVCTQRNLGARNALSDILVFSDADNRYPSYFLQGIKYRWELEQVDILSPLLEPDEKSPRNNTIAVAMNLFLDLQMSIKPHFLLESCVIIGKKCFMEVGGFDEQTNYGEGIVFMDKAAELGYQAKIVKDPTYTFSFRRLKKYGTAKIVSNTIRIQLMDLLGLDQDKLNLTKLYPMLGGNSYDIKLKLKKNKVSKFIKNFKKILKDINNQI